MVHFPSMPGVVGPLVNPLASLDPRELGRRLQAARKARGLTQAEVAEHMDVARTTVTAMEAGDREVRSDELTALARLYGRGIAELVEREAPTEAFAVQFGSVIPSTESSEELDASMFEFQRLCEDYVALEALMGVRVPVRYLPTYDFDAQHPERSAEDLANRERLRLGLGDGPCPNLGELLGADVGLRVFGLDLPSRIAAMHVYDAELGGCVAVNRNHSPGRRRDSLAHAYGHFVTERFRPDVNVLGRYQRSPASERFAEAFARDFLLPATGVIRRFNDLARAGSGKLTVADVCLLAHQFVVSVQAMTLRLEELGLIGSGTWDRLRRESHEAPEARSRPEQASPPETERALPIRYRYLAVAAFASGELSEGQLARYLRTDRVHARRIAAGLASHVTLRDEGELDRVAPDLSSII